MPVEIRVPALGESVVEATIAQWLKSPGDRVEAGEPLVELETDKVNVEVPAEVSGILGDLAKQTGDTVGVGEVLGTVSESGASESAAAPVAAGAVSASNGSAPAAVAAPAAAAHTTPTAAAIAAANNIDLSGVAGTLPGGRIGKDDVARASSQAPATAQQKMEERSASPVTVSAPPATLPAANIRPVAAPTPTPAVSSGRPEERIKLTRRRQVIARNLVEAQQTAAMLTTFNEIDMTAVMELRKRRRDTFKEKFGVGLGFMSFFTKAVVGGLKQFPYVNSEIQGDEVVLKKYYDIGIAVGLEEGLVVPVVRDADRLTFAGIEKEIGALAAKARDNKLALSELTGGTFTITNGGTYGSLMSTPILNAPQVGILGMHNIVPRPVVVNNEIAIRPMMYVALTYDHRIIDGSTAVRFLVKVKELVEDPESLLLEG